MATKMRTGRMTVKTTTKPNGGGGRTIAQYKSMSAEDQYKEWVSEQKKAPNYEYSAGIGRKAGGAKLSDSELELFNKNKEAEGFNMLAKEVRYSKGDEGASSGKPSGFQVYYADPTKDKALYDAAAKKRQSAAKGTDRFNPSTSPKKVEKVEVGKLPTRKLASSTPKPTLMTPQKRTEMVNKAIEGPGGKTRQFKNTPRVGGPIQKNKITKTKLNIKGQIEGAKFRREEKLAGAYERTKALADENQGPRIVAGAFSKEKKAGYKTMRSDLRAARKETGVKVGSAIRDTRKAQRFEKKEQVGKTKYFTKAKMNEKVEKKPGMKPINQAGKTRYKK